MANIPAIVKHMTLAIAKKQGGRTSKAAFKRSFDAAISRCLEYGFITGGGLDYQLTPKGRAARHEHEGMRGFAKDKMFDFMFAWIVREKRDEKVGNTVKGTEPQSSESEQDYASHTLGRSKK